MIKVIHAESKEEIDHARELVKEYAISLDFDLCYEGFEKELAEFPSKYAPPDGCLLLALNGIQRAGCVALRKIVDGICEMKRLYVRPEFRRKGIGKVLAVTIIEEARNRGYKYMRLDTISSMREAIELYRTLGFKDIEPYCYNPSKSAIYMELTL